MATRIESPRGFYLFPSCSVFFYFISGSLTPHARFPLTWCFNIPPPLNPTVTQIPRPDSPTRAKERARSAERSRYLLRSTQETVRDTESELSLRHEFAPRPQSASAALDRKLSSGGALSSGVAGLTTGVKVATVNEEPTTFMRDIGLGGEGGSGSGVGGEDVLARARDALDTSSRIAIAEEVEEEEVEEEEEGEGDGEGGEEDEWTAAERERERRREDLRRRRKALEDRIPTRPKPEKPPPPPKTRMESGLDFLRRDIGHVVARAAVVTSQKKGSRDGGDEDDETETETETGGAKSRRRRRR